MRAYMYMMVNYIQLNARSNQMATLTVITYRQQNTSTNEKRAREKSCSLKHEQSFVEMAI